MANEELSDKIESTVEGVKQFALRFVKTFLAIIFRPRALVGSLLEEGSSGVFLGPNSFLLSCAIALGFLGKTLANGFREIGLNTLLQLKELTLTSFLIQSIALFVIAIAGSGVVELALYGRSAQEKQRIKVINYYVIGFFVIGSLVVLLLLSLLLLSVPDFSARTRYTVYFAIGAYVLAVFVVMQRMSGQVLRAGSNTGPILAPALRTGVVNAFVIFLCILNLLSPLSGWVG